MADYSCVYTLNCGGGGTILFNNGQFGNGSLDDLYWITVIHGLDSPTLRTPSDDVPFGHGGIYHKFWKGPRHPVVEGTLIVQSVSINQCQAIFNALEKDLRTALESIIQTPGTLSWTPAGDSPHSLSVYYEVGLDIQPTDNYATRSFNFGLFSPSADPS